MKKLTALLLALVMVLSLAACSSDKSAPASEATAAAEQPAQDTAAGETAAADAEEFTEPVTLTYWLPCDDLDDAAECTGVIAALRAFMEKYPNITIDMIPISHNSDENNAKVQMAAAANNLPELFSFSYSWVKDLAGTGVIMELSDIVDKISDNYTSDAIDFTNSAVDGYWAIPYTTEVQGWAYNTEILDQYNLDVPTTFDEFLNVCNVLAANGERAIAHGATDIWAIWGYHAMFCQEGVDKTMVDELSNGTLDFYSNESFRKTLSYIQQIADTGAYGDAVAYTSNDEAEAAFINGDAAMYNFATSFVSELEESEHANSFVFNYGPQLPDSVQDKTVGLRVFGWDCYVGSCVEKDPNKLKAVELWLEYLTSQEGTDVLWNAGTIPATDLSKVDMSGKDDFMKSIFAAIAADDVYSVPDLCVGWFDPSVKVPYRTAVTSIITGTSTIDEAMQLLADWQTTFAG